MVFVYPNEYSYILRRLSSGGETSLKATFLATTLGLRRLSNVLNRSNFHSVIFAFSSSRIKLFLIFRKIFKNQKLIFRIKKKDSKRKESFWKNWVYVGGKTLICCGFSHSGWAKPLRRG